MSASEFELFILIYNPFSAHPLKGAREERDTVYHYRKRPGQWKMDWRKRLQETEMAATGIQEIPEGQNLHLGNN